MSGKQISRRQLLSRTGSIAVAFSFANDLLGDLATVVAAPGAKDVTVIPPPPAGQNPPYADTVAWLIIEPNGVTIRSGRVELGTGVRTAMIQIALEELRLQWKDAYRYDQGDTRLTADEGFTAGSKSIQNGGPLVRRAAATAYQELLTRAAETLGVDRSQLRPTGDGKFQVVGSNKQVTYQALLQKNATVLVSNNAAVPVADPAGYTLVGTSVPRDDLPGKLFAQPAYVQDIALDGMLHARVIRPSGRNDTFGSFDAATLATAAAIPGFVQVVQQGNFVAVLADTEWAAIKASTVRFGGVRVNWNSGPPLVAEADLPAALTDPANIYGTNTEVAFPGFDAAYADAQTKVQAEYFTPFQMHAPFGPSCAVADVRSTADPITGVRATVWSQTQGVYPLRRALSGLLGFAETEVHVIYEEGAGCYGQCGADDVAGDAALLSKLSGRPVRVQWSRQDEHGWEPLGPAMVHRMQGGITGSTVVAWDHSVYSPTHNTRPSGTNGGTLTAGMLTGSLPNSLGSAAGTNTSTRNAPLNYTFPNRLRQHAVRSYVTTSPAGDNSAAARAPKAPLTWKFLRSTALRSLGGFSNSFANESFLGELSAAADLDDLQVRIDHLSDPRAIAVMEALRPTWAARPVGVDGRGAGIAFQRYETIEAYTGVYVEVTVSRTTGVIRVERVVVSHDCGLIINPDGLKNQIEGNVIQGIGRTLIEEVHFSSKGVTSTVWERNPAFFINSPQYSVLKFNETPASIESILIDDPEAVAWGAGEPTIGAVGGAIGNAVHHAVGIRLRSLPMLPRKVLAALAAV